MKTLFLFICLLGMCFAGNSQNENDKIIPATVLDKPTIYPECMDARNPKHCTDNFLRYRIVKKLVEGNNAEAISIAFKKRKEAGEDKATIPFMITIGPEGRVTKVACHQNNWCAHYDHIEFLDDLLGLQFPPLNDPRFEGYSIAYIIRVAMPTNFDPEKIISIHEQAYLNSRDY